jgi:hypothetical protein
MKMVASLTERGSCHAVAKFFFFSPAWGQEYAKKPDHVSPCVFWFLVYLASSQAAEGFGGHDQGSCGGTRAGRAIPGFGRGRNGEGEFRNV